MRKKYKNIKVIAMDSDGTLTQYKTPVSPEHREVIYIGDDYGLGGNDESVYKSDFPYITTDNYLDFHKKVAVLLK